MLLRAENISLCYKDGEQTITAVNQISLIVENHQLLGVLGPSGSGKSSLLYLLSGLKRTTHGCIYFEDRCYNNMRESELTALRRKKFGFIFQQHFLINYLTALENVLTAAPNQSRATWEKAVELLDDLGLSDKTHRFPHQLSGGERQRVSIARAMINDPQIIFADEPTGQLDQATGFQVMNLMRPYQEKGSLIVATHDPEMLSGADRIIQLQDGKLRDETCLRLNQSVGSPTLPYSPPV